MALIQVQYDAYNRHFRPIDPMLESLVDGQVYLVQTDASPSGRESRQHAEPEDSDQ